VWRHSDTLLTTGMLQNICLSNEDKTTLL